MKAIPVYSLDERKGLIVTQFTGDKVPVKPAHRDDHYIFIFQEEGRSRLMLDFKEIVLEGCCVLCILPGQVHYGLAVTNTLAWFLAVDPEWINDRLRPLFLANTTVKVEQAAIIKRAVLLLSEISETMPAAVIRSMLDACMGMFAAAYEQIATPEHISGSRVNIINRQFKTLLSQSYKTMKSPADYATQLNISTAYLNEAVKAATGFSVSYWIQQDVILEAKRILYYTDNGVKEIAHMLGYDDYAYFSRLFSKVAGLSPMQFREKYRESSI